jgi:rhodanese-related sulfurtransferase
MKILISLLIIMITSQAEAGLWEQYQRVKSGEAVLLDVREATEVEQGMVKGAKWFPLSQAQSGAGWPQLLRELRLAEEVFIYCRSGSRSSKMQQKLKQAGIESKNLGGFEDFTAAGIPTQPGPSD